MTQYSIKFNGYNEDAVLKAVEKFSKRAESRNIPFSFEIKEPKLHKFKAFRKAKKGDKVFELMDSSGGYWAFSKKYDSFIHEADFDHLVFTLLNPKITPPEKRLSPQEVSNFKFKDKSSTKTLIVEYDPPTKWEVIASCEPANPDNPDGSPAIWNMIPRYDPKTFEMVYPPLIEKIGRKKLPEKYLDHCDHCKSGKRKRAKVLVVKDPKGSMKIVGRSCLLSYTGLDPTDLETLIDMTKWADGGGGGGHRWTKSTIPTRLVKIMVSAYALKNHSYRKGMGSTLCDPPRPRRGEVGNKWILEKDSYQLHWYHPHEKKWKKLDWVIGNPFKNPLKEISQHEFPELVYHLDLKPEIETMTVLWDTYIDNMKTQPSNDFTRKVLSVHDADVCTSKTINVYAGASSRWLKTIHEEWFNAQTEMVKDEPTKALNLDVGIRFTKAVRFFDQRHTKNGYTLTEFRTPQNEAIVSFGNFDATGLKPNDEITITATVKRHGSWQGNGSTTVNRIVVA